MTQGIVGGCARVAVLRWFQYTKNRPLMQERGRKRRRPRGAVYVCMIASGLTDRARLGIVPASTGRVIALEYVSNAAQGGEVDGLRGTRGAIPLP